MTKVYVNGRFLTQKVTGVQRVAKAYVNAMRRSDEIDLKIFHTPKGFLGILYEHFVMPFLVPKGHFLISFCNTAPLFYGSNVIFVHDVAVVKYPHWFSAKFHYFYRFMWGVIVPRAKAIITVSNFSKREICEFYDLPASKVNVIKNGVDLISGVSEPIAELANTEYFLAVASIDPRKGFSLIIDAWLDQKINHGNKKLVIAGGAGSSFSKNIDYEHGESSIVFLGYVSDKKLAWLYENCQCFISMSEYEGFGLPVGEAVLYGSRVIASEIEAHREVVNDEADNVVFVPVNSQVLLSEAIRQELGHPNVKNSVNKNFMKCNSWDKRLDKLIRLFGDISESRDSA